MLQKIDPEGMAFNGMSQAVQAGEWLTLSGQVAFSNGKMVGVDDPYEQALQCFRNLQSVLEAAGVPQTNLVLLRCYLTDRAHYAEYARAKQAFLGEHAPASTAVVVSELLVAGLLLEVEAVAYTGE